MKVLSPHIDDFGKLHDQDISFQGGMNVVYGKSEAGKSTLHTSIKGVLFGLERQRGHTARNDTYGRYEPWQGSGTYEGWLRLESEGQVYRIQRRFHKRSRELTTVNETLGREVEPTKVLLDQLRCGLSETVYDNTISIRQLKCATEGGMVSELRNHIANLNASGSIALNITKATTCLKAQRKELENQLVPEAARTCTGLLGKICKVEQEISAPKYANQPIACRIKKTEVRKQLDRLQREKEGSLEKAAKGRQILLNSQFTDQASVQIYIDDTEKLYGEYGRARAACSKKSRTVYAVFMFLITLVCSGISAACLAALQAVRTLVQAPLHMTAATGIAGGIALAALIIATVQLDKSSRFKKEPDTNTCLLQEMFARHLGDSSVSPEAMNALGGRMAEFLHLSKAVEQSEQTLEQLTAEIGQPQSKEDIFLEEIEKQRRIQWELEKKLEHLADCKTRAEVLKHVLVENERIQEELNATGLAQDTMTVLSTSIRDSFGLYLNKTASDLISEITGGIYRSMSIDENLDMFMNTPGKLVPIEQVSSGTMDQIYLAVHLATAKSIQNGRDTMPLIFDDSFTLYDDDRLRTALKWLVKAYDSQITMFTYHQREAQLLTANQVKYHLITI